ncbi:MAG: geranylgeranylglyceryl/heptaprenylglyceryl phosphate synthase [Candidatus Nanosalina sp.]
MRPWNRILDYGVRREISETGLSVLKEAVEDSPLIAKYDPEDFDEDGFSAEEIENVLSMPMVGGVQIGGSGDSVTNDNMSTAFSRINEANEEHGVTVLLEPGKPEDVENGGLDSSLLTEPDIFNKPRIWNTEDSKWINGHHRYFQQLLNGKLDEKAYGMIEGNLRDELGEKIPGGGSHLGGLTDRAVQSYMDEIGEDGAQALARQKVDSGTVTEMYYVVNPDSTVAEVTGADEEILSMTWGEVEADIRGMVSDLAQDGYEGMIYIESSGALAPTDFVSAAREEIDMHGISEDTVLAYGGGIGTEETVDIFEYDTGIAEMETADQIDEYLEAGADTVIVGNSIQDDGEEALK